MVNIDLLFLLHVNSVRVLHSELSEYRSRGLCGPLYDEAGVVAGQEPGKSLIKSLILDDATQ